MGDGDPDAAHLRSERRGQAGVPIHRGEEQLVERAFHGRNSTTKVRGLCGTTVPFTWRMVAVTTTESGIGPGSSRTRTAAMPVAGLVNTVSLGTNVTAAPVSGKMLKAYTTRRPPAIPPNATACTRSESERESAAVSGGTGVTNTVSFASPAVWIESSRARMFTTSGLENRRPVRACSRAVPTAFANETPVVLSCTVRAVSSEFQ